MTKKDKLATPDIGELLRRLVAALALEGADRYNIKAYRRIAETRSQ
jgi:hypothetical protein